MRRPSFVVTLVSSFHCSTTSPANLTQHSTTTTTSSSLSDEELTIVFLN